MINKIRELIRSRKEAAITAKLEELAEHRRQLEDGTALKRINVEMLNLTKRLFEL